MPADFCSQMDTSCRQLDLLRHSTQCDTHKKPTAYMHAWSSGQQRQGNGCCVSLFVVLQPHSQIKTRERQRERSRTSGSIPPVCYLERLRMNEEEWAGPTRPIATIIGLMTGVITQARPTRAKTKQIPLIRSQKPDNQSELKPEKPPSGDKAFVFQFLSLN